MENQKLPIEDPVIYEEKRIIKRLTFKTWFINILQAFEFERGSIYTLKWLFKNPGKLIRMYIGADRFNVVAPFKMLVITSAIAVLLSIELNIDYDFFKGLANDQPEEYDKILNFYNDYYNLLLWIAIPVFSLFTWIGIRRSFNFIEHAIISIYYLSLYNILFLLFSPVYIFWKDYDFLFYFVIIIYFIYSYSVALNLTKWYHYLRLLISGLVSIFTYLIIFGAMFFIFTADH